MSERAVDPTGGDAVRAASSDLSARRDGSAPPRAREGHVEVVLLSAAVQRYGAGTAADATFGAGTGSRLVVALRVRNVSPTSKLTYRPWSAGAIVASAPEPRLVDDAGRRYRLVGFDFGRDAVATGAELGPGEAATDVLAFEAPSGAFTHLDLELPPGNTGGHGASTLSLRIPASAVCR